MTLLICPVREGEDNEQLRYALRSWETNLLLEGGLELLVVGHKPSWLTPEHWIVGNLYERAETNVFDNVVLGADAAMHLYEGDDDVLFMNDDFFCLDPVLDVPVFRRNRLLAEHININERWAHLSFIRSLALTASWLSDQGYPSPWSWEVHRPLRCKPQAMFSALAKVPFDPEKELPQWRTVYGTLSGAEAIPVNDVKLGVATSMVVGTPWLSTSDAAWPKYGPDLMARFQKRSRWEIR